MVQTGFWMGRGLARRLMFALLGCEVFSQRPVGILQAFTTAIIGVSGATPSAYNSYMLILQVVCSMLEHCFAGT